MKRGGDIRDGYISLAREVKNGERKAKMSFFQDFTVVTPGEEGGTPHSPPDGSIAVPAQKSKLSNLARA